MAGAGNCALPRQIFEWVKAHGGEPIIPFSGIFENKLFDMPDDEKAAYCKEVSLEVPGGAVRMPVDLAHWSYEGMHSGCVPALIVTLGCAGGGSERAAEDYHHRLPRHPGARQRSPHC